MSSPELYTMPPLSPILHSPVLACTHTPSSPLFSPSSSLSTSNISNFSQTAKIRRPPNAFLLFRSDFLKSNQIPPDEECRQQTLSSVAGECWNMLSSDEKAAWKRKADEVKHAHMARYPGYKYSPSRGTKSSKKTKKSKLCNDATLLEKEERTKKLREEFTPFKGEAVPSQRKAKELARSVRGTERAARSKKAPASTSISASGPVASTKPISSSTSILSSSRSSSSATNSALFAPLPLLAPHGAFVPSATRLAPAPSTGPQITRITQSPPLTPFHPSDRQPQLQLQLSEIALRNPSTVQWGLRQERAFGLGSDMREISLSQGNVYPATGASNASAYFEPRGPGMHITMPVSDSNHFCSRSHSLDAGVGNMSMDNYHNFRVGYPSFSMDDIFMGNYREAPETPYDLSDALCFSPAASPLSPAWSCHPLTPSSYSSPKPQTTLTLTAPYHDYEPKFEQGSLELSESGRADLSYFDATAGTSHTAYGAHDHDHGAWSQELGACGLEIELGTMLHF